MTGASRFAVKRIYLPPAAADGSRVLVERLWPRGLSRARAAVDLWLKQAAPSHELRRWFHAAPKARWPEFQRHYRAELQEAPEALAELRRQAAGRVSLLFAARDEAHNSAVVLKAILDEGPGGG